jgi:hypothetical protein
MGGKSLMKKILLPFSVTVVITIYPLWGELSVSQIDQMVEKIQQKRVSKVEVDFDKVPTPFVIVKMDQESNDTILSSPEKKVVMKVYAIINDGTEDSSANINGMWLHRNDSIDGYTVVEIKSDKVVLKKGDNTMELFLPKKPIEIPQIKINEG